MNLTRFETKDGIELIIDRQTGESFATQAGYARMSGKSKSTISERMSRGVRLGDIIEAEIQTAGGLQGVRLIPADVVYDWMFEDNPALAKAMGKAGATVFMHQLAGFKVASTAIAPAPQPEPVKVELTPAKLDLLRSAMSSVPTPLVDGFILNRVQFHYPELKADINAAHGLLAATNPISELLLTPTAIGDRLGVSARVVNALLTENGYQTKNHAKSKTEPAYLPTELGDRHSSNTLATGKGSDSTSYQHTKWQESIVEVLRTLM